MRCFEASKRMSDVVYIGRDIECRQILDTLLQDESKNVENFNELEVKLIRPKTDFDPKLMCFGYLFYDDIFDTDKLLRTIRDSEEKPQEGDLLNILGNSMTLVMLKDQKKYRTNDWKDGSMVMYSSLRNFPVGTINHVGIIKDGKVDSKFDARGAFLHPKEIVPYTPCEYGPWIANFKFNKKIVSDFWTKIFKQAIPFLKS